MNETIGNSHVENGLNDLSTEELREQELESIREQEIDYGEKREYMRDETPKGNSVMKPMKKQKHDTREYIDWKDYTN